MTEVYSSGATTLSASITDVQTSFSIASGSAFPAITYGESLRIQVESEIMRCFFHNSNATTLFVVRGQEGTTAVAHASGKDVVAVLTSEVVGLTRAQLQSRIRQIGDTGAPVLGSDAPATTIGTDTSAPLVQVQLRTADGNRTNRVIFAVPHVAGQKTLVTHYSSRANGGSFGRMLVLPASGLLNGVYDGMFLQGGSLSLVSEGTNMYCEDSQDEIYRAIGGTAHQSYESAIMVWTSDTINSIPTMTGPAATRHSGALWVTDGANHSFCPVYKPSGTWTAKTADSSSRTMHGLVAFGASAFALGGIVSSAVVATTSKYSISGDSWASDQALTTGRKLMAVASLPVTGVVLTCGGETSGAAASTTTEYYTGSGSWTTSTALGAGIIAYSGGAVTHRSLGIANATGSTWSEFDYPLAVHTSRTAYTHGSTLTARISSALCERGHYRGPDTTGSGVFVVWTRATGVWSTLVGNTTFGSNATTGATV